jgi:hypothetical protein
MRLPLPLPTPETRARQRRWHFANSGEGAPEQLAEGIEPHLIVILSDINMPGMDGLTLSGLVGRNQAAVPRPDGDDGDLWRRRAPPQRQASWAPQSFSPSQLILACSKSRCGNCQRQRIKELTARANVRLAA